ncbi:ABC transporter ATP-binding protein [Pseudoalteromonas phenolica]|uniref:ABC transporter ATP-binding protein n=1 Tax=Pseudoalteromonas phenolica TaxID=161398 RepID=A0A0S2JZS7_9GAMM|nr:ABC transporter ATP-binding protein [Pseudoalteromonas phenolica]ALO41719.1 ABC transporter ATP-binding protein [Pseudoalteromonas phenolica]MBE0353728.1 putative ABC transport system ATP-binding protein [Pseudoalteromonas phenolica O-BC30]RXE95026.1 ABC transporter ATP-binding protein [Pseudoalteromonas phenolica O-BC30]
MISVTDLCFSRADGDQVQTLFDDFSFEVSTKEQVALLGDSGSGKTTLLHLLAGLLTPDGGQIIINGEVISAYNDKQLAHYRRKIGLIFQHYQLLDCLTVKQNILFQHQLNYPNQTAKEFDLLIEQLGLNGKLNKLPHQLSGGEQQRVGIVRALINQPKLILADEPTGNLDQARSHQVVEMLTSLCKERQINLIMVTHSQQLTQYFDTVKVLANGQFNE